MGDAGAVRVVLTAAELSSALDEARSAGASVGLVPTMGALHAGHRSLVERASAECGFVAVTIFVNPLQFDDPADLAAYPRDLEADLETLGDAGADVVFVPEVSELYPDHPRSPATTVHVSGVSDRPRREVPARPLRRRHDRGDQALRDGRPVPRLFRREGFPAGCRRPQTRPRPVHAGRGGGLPDGP